MLTGSMPLSGVLFSGSLSSGRAGSAMFLYRYVLMALMSVRQNKSLKFKSCCSFSLKKTSKMCQAKGGKGFEHWGTSALPLHLYIPLSFPSS